MPQLIAMIIVVVGALIYMFQTFGGTGDKIEGIAQKSSIITEIANVKSGLELALKSGDIDAGTTLKDLADKDYFAKQMNEEIITKGDGTYSAISFGGGSDDSVVIKLVTPASTDDPAKIKAAIPAILVTIGGKLDDNKDFLEAQISNDLKAVANIDITGSSTYATNPPTSEETATPGVFTIYYKDLPKGYITK